MSNVYAVYAGDIEVNGAQPWHRLATVIQDILRNIGVEATPKRVRVDGKFLRFG